MINLLLFPPLYALLHYLIAYAFMRLCYGRNAILLALICASNWLLSLLQSSRSIYIEDKDMNLIQVFHDDTPAYQYQVKGRS
jgi:hypothetical protein